jgi:hypothetical protein
MSSLPDEQSPSPHRAIPLGRLLVAHGLLTEEQLIEGLLEQDRTGDRLGMVLIRLGFVDAPSVAMALASQHGGPLKTEYGFATGFPGEPIEPVTEPSEATEQPEATEPPEATEQTQAAEQPQATEQPAATATASTENGAALGDLRTFLAVLDRAPGQIDAMIAERDAARMELDTAQARIADLEQELAATREQLAERRSKAAELEEKLAGDRLAAETAITALRGVAGALP